MFKRFAYLLLSRGPFGPAKRMDASIAKKAA